MRTCGFASAALYALISIDNVLTVALGDSINRALACACAASNALIGNLVCHCDIPPINIDEIILSYFEKKSRFFCKIQQKNFANYAKASVLFILRLLFVMLVMLFVVSFGLFLKIYGRVSGNADFRD